MAATRTPGLRGGTHVEVAVVGAGQAGLAVSWHLVRRGIEHVVLEADEVGHEWRDRRWDTFCLVTPNWQCDLPGYAYGDQHPGDDPDGFMLREEVVDYVRGYAASFPVPLREHTAARRLTVDPDAGGYELVTDDAVITADQVVVATGPYQSPRIPRLADWLDRDLHQLHSSQYRAPEQLPPGAVMVVGSGQSGAQIAEDLHRAGRRVHLFTGTAPRVARSYRGRDVVAWLADMGYYDRSVGDFDDVDSVRFRVNHYVTGRDGGHDIDLRAFAREGMRVYGRLLSAHGHTVETAPDLTAHLDGADEVSESIKDSIDTWISEHDLDAPTEDRYTPVWSPETDPTGLDLAAAGVTSVVWATGYSRADRWIEVPVFDGRGYPTHRRGVTSCPGLYFVGLPWQHTWGSGRFGGVGDDAAYLAERIDAHRARRQELAPASDTLRWIAGATSRARVAGARGGAGRRVDTETVA